MLIISYLILAGLAVLGAVYIKNYFGQLLLVLIVFVGLFLWMVGADYPIYQDLSVNGIETTGIVIDYEKQSSFRKGRERVSHLYTFAIGTEQIRRISLAEPKYQIGTEVPVLYSPQGEGCLVGSPKGSPFELAKYALANGRCFKIREDLETAYKEKLNNNAP